MELSDGEKLILIMLSELYARLGTTGEIDPQFVREAIQTGNAWAIASRYNLGSKEHDAPVVKETRDILWMWNSIEEHYERLSPDEQKRIEDSVGPLGKGPRFEGFDWNDAIEAQYVSVADMIKRLGDFKRFKDRATNSHGRILDSYRRMYAAFEPLIMQRRGSGGLTVDDLIAILRERIHPTQRQSPERLN